ncbi:MAG: copper amine oxidase N-terminal domain-containing protein [Bacillota bacterium]
MKKRSRKLISVLLTLALLATLLVPMATPAAAGSTYSVSNAPTLAPSVKGGTPAALGTFTITLDAASVTSAAYGKYVYLELPADFQFRKSDGTAFADGDNLGTLGYLSLPTQGTDYAFSTAGTDLTVTTENGGNRVKVLINAAPGDADGLLYLKPGIVILQNLKLFVPSGAADGPVQVTTIAPSSSVFTGGQKIDIAKIGASSVKVFISGSPATIGPDGDFVTMYVQEASAGAMAYSASAMKFTLPSGFQWTTTGATSETYWNAGTVGSAANSVVARLALSNDNRTLAIDNLTGLASAGLSGSYFKLKVKVVPDATSARTGDLEVTLGGDSTYTPSTLVVGTYGDYGTKLSAGSTPDIYAGKYGQKVGTIVIEETLKGSLLNGRTLYLTLPSGAKWNKMPVLDTTVSTTGGITNNAFTASSTDARVAKLTIAGAPTTDKAKLVFKDGEVITAADFTGELKVTATGSLGFTGDIAIAKVKPAVTATVASKSELKIGVAGQAVSDIVIEEATKEMFALNSKPMDVNGIAANLVGQPAAAAVTGAVVVTAPSGVTFASMPTVVVEGDVKVDSSSTAASLTANKNAVTIPIQSTSTKASKIVLKNVKLNVDRTVVEGDLKLNVGGAAVLDDTLNGVTSKLFEPARNAAEVVVGAVVTPAPGETKANASFTIGSTTYKVAGVEQTMDVAPYIKDGRTYLPVRYVAQALGVVDSNILWDGANQTVTLLKGDKVVQLKIGSKAMIVNGVTITMDTAPEITSGRTMLPFRFIAQAMGASVAWDEATQTVTLN